MRIALGAAIAVLATPALAGPKCTDAPQSQWLSKDQMMVLIAELGHSVEVFKKTTGNCYEIYGRDSDGRRVEVYFHPVTGKVVRSSVL